MIKTKEMEKIELLLQRVRYQRFVYFPLNCKVQHRMNVTYVPNEKRPLEGVVGPRMRPEG